MLMKMLGGLGCDCDLVTVVTATERGNNAGKYPTDKTNKGAHTKREAGNVSEPLQSEVQSDVSQGERDYVPYDHIIFIILKYFYFSDYNT